MNQVTKKVQYCQNCRCCTDFSSVCESCGSYNLNEFVVDSRYTDLVQFNAHRSMSKYKELSKK